MTDTDNDHNPDGWTFASLRAYVDRRFLDSATAIEKAEISTDRRLEAANNVKEQMGQDIRDLLPRPEFQVLHSDLTRRSDEANLRLTKLEGLRAGGQYVWGMVLSIVLGAGSVIAIVVTHIH